MSGVLFETLWTGFSEHLEFDSILYVQSTAPIELSCSYERSALLQTRLQGLKLGTRKMKYTQLDFSC